MILYICSQARLRSRTAELLCLFGGLDARSAGIDADALCTVTDAMLRQADLVVCMQPKHSAAIADFPHFEPSRVLTLDIPDRFDRLEPALIDELVSCLREHRPDIADAMQRGAQVLAGLPGYRDSLGTRSPAFFADNPAFRVLPSV